MDLFENNNTSKLFNLMVSDYHQVVYCIPPNIGCNTFRNLLYKDNVSDVVNMRQPKIHNVFSYLREHNVVPLSKFTVEEAKYRLDSYHKFIVVQHPFSRLLSAFREQFIPYGWNVSQFEEVIKGFFSSRNTSKTLPLAEFLKLIVARSAAFRHSHWDKHYNMCFPCAINYQQIVKMETLEDDYEPLIRYIFGSSGNMSALQMQNLVHHLPERQPRRVGTVFFKQSNKLIKRLIDFYMVFPVKLIIITWITLAYVSGCLVDGRWSKLQLCNPLQPRQETAV